LDIDYNEKPRYSVPDYPDYQSFSLWVFQNDSNRKFVELFKLIEQLTYYCSMSDIEKIRIELCKQFSWTGFARIDNFAVLDSIAKVIQKIEKKSEEKDKSAVNKFIDGIMI
jgi:hypothetical protein